ncbi:MAG TPA: hypothetical protein VLV18_03095 [Terriglobales bacterium]|nr:hypothetical protein [Terriglobales bacterium]
MYLTIKSNQVYSAHYALTVSLGLVDGIGLQVLLSSKHSRLYGLQSVWAKNLQFLQQTLL